MRINKELSSYPILLNGDDDYVDSYFYVNMKEKLEPEQLTLTIMCDLNNDGIRELIRMKKVAYVVHIEDSAYCHRKAIVFFNDTKEIKIDLNDIGGTIEASVNIVALEDLDQYKNTKLNWIYGNDGIDISKGNIMGIGQTYKVDISRSKEELKKVTDVIKISQYKGRDKSETNVVIDGDVIIIYVSKVIKDSYFLYGKEYFYSTLSMLIVPAMQFVLFSMKNNQENLRDYKWFTIIENVLNEIGVEVEELDENISSGKNSICELAQKIFKSPIEKGILELGKGNWDE